MKPKKKLVIIHKDNVTNIYDEDGNDLTKQMYIRDCSVEFVAGSEPLIHMTIFGPEVEIQTEYNDIKIKSEEYYKFG